MLYEYFTNAWNWVLLFEEYKWKTTNAIFAIPPKMLMSVVTGGGKHYNFVFVCLNVDIIGWSLIRVGDSDMN